MARDRFGKLIGTYKCWACKKEVPVRRKADNAGAKLSAPCPWCGFGHYANPGTEHFEIFLSQVELNAPPAAAPAADPAPPAPAADPEKPPASAKRSIGSPLFGR